MHQTGAQVYFGLAGLFIIDNDGGLVYIGSMHDRMMGMEGDTILVNGVITPT